MAYHGIEAILRIDPRIGKILIGFADQPRHAMSTTSGRDPRRRAMTGVPHASDSAMTRPNGSGQSIGKRSAQAAPRKSEFFGIVHLPDDFDPGLLQERPSHASD